MYQQIQLPYAFNALEPNIDALTMETHYTKHHAGYTKNLNEAAAEAGVADKEITDLLCTLSSISDEALRKKIRNNGGGFYNHNIYFRTLSPKGGGQPSGKLGNEIEKSLGGFSTFKEDISKLAANQFGSGWAWLSVAKDGKLVLSSSPNQDNPLSEGKDLIPIFGIDVWEHAYYLKYKNLRADYVKALFNVVDWHAVEKNYPQALNK